MKCCILVAITTCFIACGEEISPTDRTVHLAGYVADSNRDGDGVASYWKDNVYTSLTDNGMLSRVSSLYVDGSSVLIGGWKRIPNSSSVAVMWQDGKETELQGVLGGPLIASHHNNLFRVWYDPTGWVFNKNATSQLLQDTAYNFAPMAMAVLGDDAYLSGYSSGPALPPNYSPPQHAQCWKNGRLIFRERDASNALSIFVHEDDIYMAGQRYDPDVANSTACYWKNGTRVNVTDGSKAAIAKSIFVTDTHVYLAGMIDDQAVYWKDGEATFLTTAGTYSMANSIFVQGTDIHVAGYEHGHPAYWKNNERQQIPNQDKLGQVLFVVVGSN